MNTAYSLYDLGMVLDAYHKIHRVNTVKEMSTKSRQTNGYRPQSRACPVAGCWRDSGVSFCDTAYASRSKQSALLNSQTTRCRLNTDDPPAWYDSASLCPPLWKQQQGDHTMRCHSASINIYGHYRTLIRSHTLPEKAQKDANNRPTIQRVCIRHVCCHSNQICAPTANPPNSAQLGGIRGTRGHYHSSKLHPSPCSSVGMRQGTHTQTAVATIHFAWLCQVQDVTKQCQGNLLPCMW